MQNIGRRSQAIQTLWWLVGLGVAGCAAISLLIVVGLMSFSRADTAPRGFRVHQSDYRGEDEQGRSMWRCFWCKDFDHSRPRCMMCGGSGVMHDNGKVGKIVIVPDSVTSHYY